MRNLVFGSYSARGKKKRRNISRLMLSEPSTAAITKRRRRAIDSAFVGIFALGKNALECFGQGRLRLRLRRRRPGGLCRGIRHFVPMTPFRGRNPLSASTRERSPNARSDKWQAGMKTKPERLRNEWPYGNPVTEEPETHRASHPCSHPWLLYPVDILYPNRRFASKGRQICQAREAAIAAWRQSVE